MQNAAQNLFIFQEIYHDITYYITGFFTHLSLVLNICIMKNSKAYICNKYFYISYWGRPGKYNQAKMHVCITEIHHHLFMWWHIFYSVPSHYLINLGKQSYFVIDWWDSTQKCSCLLGRFYITKVELINQLTFIFREKKVWLLLIDLFYITLCHQYVLIDLVLSIVLIAHYWHHVSLVV